jgi:hypothetical protein
MINKKILIFAPSPIRSMGQSMKIIQESPFIPLSGISLEEKAKNSDLS